MIDFEKLANEGFKLLNGQIYNRYGTIVLEYNANVTQFGWGTPCTEYRFTNYDYSSYSIERSTQYHDEWYLKKDGYRNICRLRYLGGENWETYYP